MVELTSKPLITDQDLKNLSMGETVRIDEKAIVTPLAVDTARERQLHIERVAILRSESKADRMRKIAVGADLGGFEMKQELKKFLSELGYEVLDLGTHSTAAVGRLFWPVSVPGGRRGFQACLLLSTARALSRRPEMTMA